MIFKFRIAALAWLVAALAVSAPGCTKSTGIESVHGTIKYQGQPLRKAAVTFYPTSGRSITAAAPEGDYSIELKPGDYTVTVGVGIDYPPGFKEGDPVPPQKIVLPEQYTVNAKSSLTASVKSGQDEPIDFDLK